LRFEFTAEETDFRNQISAFLDDVLPDNWGGSSGLSDDDSWAMDQKFRKELVKRGWLVMSWPKDMAVPIHRR